MRYRLTEDERVRTKAARLSVREHAKYDEAKDALRRDPYPGLAERIRRLDFDDGTSIFAYFLPSLSFAVVYTVREPDVGEAFGAVRIISLIDRQAERNP